MSDASGTNSASRLLLESSVFVVVTPGRLLSGRMSKAPAEAAAKTLITVAMVVNLAV